jgi:hypothetical protein
MDANSTLKRRVVVLTLMVANVTSMLVALKWLELRPARVAFGLAVVVEGVLSIYMTGLRRKLTKWRPPHRGRGRFLVRELVG